MGVLDEYALLHVCRGAFCVGISKREANGLETRVGVVGIVVERLEAAPTVNQILHEYAEVIVGRMGVPYKEKGISIISLIVDGNMDQLSGMTGKLGRIDGVTVKSAITKK